MKRSLLSVLFLLSFLFLTNCTEDDMLMSTYLPTDVNLQAMSSDPKTPVLNKVITDGSKVTLEFTNPVAPKKPEGGYELILNGKRTNTSITPRLYSDNKYLRMNFTLDKPTTYSFQIYARWNSGYLKSNEVWGKVTESSTANSITAPSDPKQAVVNDVVIDGAKVTVKFVNFAAPKQPEGGFELLLDGKRTNTSITPRLHSDQKYVSMTFYLDNPKSHCYGIYARWNTGYLRSDDFCPGQDTPLSTSTTSSTSTSSSSSSVNFPGMPALKLLGSYEFEDNIGRNVDQARDGLIVHHLGRKDGRVVSKDGVGAYRFRITPGGSTSYRQELVPRDLPSPYFNKKWEAQWGKEYVYEMRVKLSGNYDIGREYISLIEMKNDYTTNRYATLSLLTEGDHYYVRQYSSRTETTKLRGTERKDTRYAANGQKLIPGTDFDKHLKTGNTYPKITNDFGKWVTWTFHIKWNYDDRGFIKIYKNGKLFHAYNGPTGFKDEKAPYVKFGLYNNYWGNNTATGSKEQETFVDYFRIYVPK